MRWAAAVGAAGLALVLWSAAAGADESATSLSNRPPPVLTSVPLVTQPERESGMLVGDASPADAVPQPVGPVVDAVTELVGSLPPVPVLGDATPPGDPAPRPAATAHAGADDDGANGGTASPVRSPEIGTALGAEPPPRVPLVAVAAAVQPDGIRRPHPADAPPTSEDGSHSHRVDAFAAAVRPVRCGSSLTSLDAEARSSGWPSAPPVVIAPLGSMSARSTTPPLPPARGPPTDDAS